LPCLTSGKRIKNELTPIFGDGLIGQAAVANLWLAGLATTSSQQIRWAREIGLPGDMVLLDAGYGHDAKLRNAITELKLGYVAGIQSQTLVCARGTRCGRPPKKGRRDAANAVAVKEVARRLPAKAWRTIKWREGTNDWLSSRFARIRVHVASSHQRPSKPIKEWLLIEWPEGEDEPTKYWLSTLPKNIGFRDLVDAAKLRWRIERDYEELKQEVGLGHFEGRSWRGFHHHATLCIAAYAFLISERQTIPPSRPRSIAMFSQSALSNGYRPRGAATANRTPHPQLHRNNAPTHRQHHRQAPAAMPVLPRLNASTRPTAKSVTQ
jgi:hypothetical protein